MKFINFYHQCAFNKLDSLCLSHPFHFDHPPFFLTAPFDILIVLQTVFVRIKAELAEELLLLIELSWRIVFRIHRCISRHVLSWESRLAMVIAKGSSLVNHDLRPVPFFTLRELYVKKGLWYSLHDLVWLVQLHAIQVLVIRPWISRELCWLKLPHLATRVRL